MNRITLWPGIIAIVLVLLLVTVSSVFAGVVIAETIASSDFVGGSQVQTHTVYTQGDKRKVEGRRVDVITDLDKDVLYVVDKNRRQYAEIPLKTLAMPRADENGTTVDTIRFRSTHNRRVIANLPCREYRGVVANPVRQIAVSTCVSNDMPAAAGEIAAFEHKMVTRLEGSDVGRSVGTDRHHLVLEKESVGSVRIPEVSGMRYRTASVMAITKVDSVQVERLAAEMFVPPKGFAKVDARAGANPQKPLCAPAAGDIGVIFLRPLPKPHVVAN
jgi:hypothetical protein